MPMQLFSVCLFQDDPELKGNKLLLLTCTSHHYVFFFWVYIIIELVSQSATSLRRPSRDVSYNMYFSLVWRDETAANKWLFTLQFDM